MANIDKISVKNTVYNIVSPAVVSDYIEVIGGACTKPDGYEEDEVILAKQNDVQLLFKATQDIAFGANIVENTNCVRTTLEEVLKNAGGGGGASSADQVSYDNSASGLEAENVQEAVDELASENQTLTNKLDNEIVTRSAMGAKNIFNPSMLSSGGNYIASMSADGSVIHLTNPTANSWRNTRFLIPVTPNTNYRVTAEAVYTSGHCGLDIRTLEDVTIAGRAIEASTSVDFTFNSGENTSVYLVAILTRSTSEIGDITFNNTMVRLATDADATYQPYAKTNRQLTEDSVDWDDMSKLGAINMLPNNATTQTVNGITFTANSDGSITANGTATADTLYYVDSSTRAIYKDGVYKLSGCPSGGGSNKYCLRMNPASGSNTNDFGDGAFVTITSSIAVRFEIVIFNGATVSNITFKPMLAPVDYNSDYVPYAKTNRELTEDVETRIKFVSIEETTSVFDIVANESVYPKGIVYELQASKATNGSDTLQSLLSISQYSRVIINNVIKNFEFIDVYAVNGDRFSAYIAPNSTSLSFLKMTSTGNSSITVNKAT